MMKTNESDRRPTVQGEHDDTELEEELRRAAARFDPVPGELLRAAASVFTWRTIDAELAELVFDSLVDHDEVSLVRGPAERRLDRKSTRLNSSHGYISYAVFCL